MKRIRDESYLSGMLVGLVLGGLITVPLIIKGSVVIRLAGVADEGYAWYDPLWWAGVAYGVFWIVLAWRKLDAAFRIAEWVTMKLLRVRKVELKGITEDDEDGDD